MENGIRIRSERIGIREVGQQIDNTEEEQCSIKAEGFRELHLWIDL
jgi:hypothetical protein